MVLGPDDQVLTSVGLGEVSGRGTLAREQVRR